MRDGFRILDADRHVIEPLETWRAHLDPAFRDAIPYVAPPAPGRTPVLMSLGRPVMAEIPERALVELAKAERRTAALVAASSRAEGQLRAMDDAGVDAAVLFPTVASYLVGNDGTSPELAGAFADAYNAWLYELCRRAPDRLLGAALISLHDPSTLAEQVARAVSYGWRAVVVRPNPVRGRHLAHPDLEALWAACAARGVTAVIHEGTHARLPTAGADRFRTRFALHACSHPMELMMALLALVEGGVLQRHPRLRFALLEAGCGWLPSWLWRLDEVEYRQIGAEVAEHVRRPPSAYFRDQGFVSAEPDEALLAAAVQHIGADRVLFGTDLPHLDHEGDVLQRALARRAELGDETMRRWLWENAARCFGLT
jgi:predicted TIM-barrel fold metal-dependent hydrolase